MNCQNCQQPVEPGAAFCGNCGQPVQPAAAPPPPAPPPISPIAQVVNNQAQAPPAQPAPPGPLLATPGGGAAGIPSYALAKPGQHTGETKALLALIFGVTGLAGALFVAILGVVLGIAGIIMGTMSRSSPKRKLSTAGLIVSSLAILAGLAVWVYAIKHDPRLSQNTQSNSHNISAPAVAASELSTPCYSVGFVNKLNVTNDTDSCDMNAFNGATLNTSTDAYKIYADTSQIANTGNFVSIFKPALEKDVRTNLSSFTITSEKSTRFAGSPAYIVNTANAAEHVAVAEAAVLHPATTGANVFVLVHVVNGDTADLSTLEAQWQWK